MCPLTLTPPPDEGADELDGEPRNEAEGIAVVGIDTAVLPPCSGDET
jgi:hypothetical protein